MFAPRMYSCSHISSKEGSCDCKHLFMRKARSVMAYSALYTPDHDNTQAQCVLYGSRCCGMGGCLCDFAESLYSTQDALSPAGQYVHV